MLKKNQPTHLHCDYVPFHPSSNFHLSFILLFFYKNRHLFLSVPPETGSWLTSRLAARSPIFKIAALQQPGDMSTAAAALIHPSVTVTVAADIKNAKVLLTFLT